jgi:hypothetical protein
MQGTVAKKLQRQPSESPHQHSGSYHGGKPQGEVTVIGALAPTDDQVLTTHVAPVRAHMAVN